MTVAETSSVDRFTRNDVPALVGRMKDCTIVQIHEAQDVAQAVTFDMEPFRFQLKVISMMANEWDTDVDRAWLWIGFKRDDSVDLVFVNDFNSKGHALCAFITGEGIELRSHFILAGLGRRDAELIIAHQILNFRREVREFNLARNERTRSVPNNR